MSLEAAATIGAILTGGRATRLGGGDKGLLTVGGRTIIERVAGVFRPHCRLVILNANGDPARFAAFRLPVVADSVPDQAGPLAGILAAMDWAAAQSPPAEQVFTAPGDTPFLPSDLVPRLAAARRTAGSAVVCARSGARHPVVALWATALRDDLRHALAQEGVRKVGTFLDRHAVAYADWPFEPLDPFFNVNTPDDLARANELALKVET